MANRFSVEIDSFLMSSMSHGMWGFVSKILNFNKITLPILSGVVFDGCTDGV